MIFKQACLVLPLSTKASAALSRRCLQGVLRDKAQTKSKDLADQIDELIDSKAVPAYIAEELHAVRNIGNFAAHPTKSKNTGEIVDVEEGEAEWNLDVLESVFDFYFVQPALAAKRKASLNQKLKEAGKPEIK
jgi:siderophore synthetase component